MSDGGHSDVEETSARARCTYFDSNVSNPADLQIPFVS